MTIKMNNDLEKVNQRLDEVDNSQKSAYQIAVEAMNKHYDRESFMIKVLVAIIFALICLVTYQYYERSQLVPCTTTETTTTEQDVLYNFYDSEGNLISSDLSLEEMQELIDLNKEVE